MKPWFAFEVLIYLTLKKASECTSGLKFTRRSRRTPYSSSSSDNAGLIFGWKVQYFEFLRQKERSLQAILEGLYHIPTKKKVKSLQFSFATKLLHTLDTSQPIYDSKVAELLSLPVKKRKDAAANINTCIAVYEQLQEAQQQLLSDKGIKGQIAALKDRYKSQISDGKALDFILWSAGKEAMSRGPLPE